MKRTTIWENRSFDEERALYHSRGITVRHCRFAGPADGESALKESRNVALEDCSFSLRYPLWHVRSFSMKDSVMDESCRAAIWESRGGRIERSTLSGVKALRECRDIEIQDSVITSAEFGWKCDGVTLVSSSVSSEYLFLEGRNITLRNVKMRGKYSFQYTNGLIIENSELDTKDAFWHSRRVTVRDSVVRGEYLAWFSDGLTLVNCRIIGSQPFCYCRHLRLIDCAMEETDLAFEYSDVEADVKGSILSVKNPRSGTITADAVGAVIRGDAARSCSGRVVLRDGSREL